MLLTLSILRLLESEDGEHFTARKGLSKEEIEKVLTLDKAEMGLTGKHIITNHQELQARLETMNSQD